MKKYTTPSLKVIMAFGNDIIQTSGEDEPTTAALPKSVVQGANGESLPATNLGATAFGDAYITDVTQ